MVESAQVRVGDLEREEAITRLRAHAAAGRLLPEEAEERITCAKAALRRGELDSLFEDLPADAPEIATTWEQPPLLRAVMLGEDVSDERTDPAIADPGTAPQATKFRPETKTLAPVPLPHRAQEHRDDDVRPRTMTEPSLPAIPESLRDDVLLVDDDTSAWPDGLTRSERRQRRYVLSRGDDSPVTAISGGALLFATLMWIRGLFVIAVILFLVGLVTAPIALWDVWRRRNC